jgi:hypothetical protein
LAGVPIRRLPHNLHLQRESTCRPAFGLHLGTRCKENCMPKKTSAGFLPGLVVEGAVIGLVVTLLPKIPLGQPREKAADEQPAQWIRLAEPVREPQPESPRLRPRPRSYQY